MPQKRAAPSRQKIAQARLLYDAGVAPIAEVAKLLGLSEAQFRRVRTAQGWPMRAAAGTPRNAKAAPPPFPEASGDLIARLEEAVQREFARAEATLEKKAPASIEASARTLASLVRTLAELKRMRREAGEAEKQKDAHDDDDADAGRDAPPRQLAELRAELARRLERLCGERPAG